MRSKKTRSHGKKTLQLTPTIIRAHVPARSWVTWPGGPNLILSWATSAATFTHPMIWKLACAGHPQFQWTKTSWIPYSNGHNWGIPYTVYTPITKTHPCAATACFMSMQGKHLPLVTQSHRLGSSIRLVWEYLRKIYEKRSEKPQIRIIQVLVLTGQSTVERLSTASQTSAGRSKKGGSTNEVSSNIWKMNAKTTYNTLALKLMFGYVSILSICACRYVYVIYLNLNYWSWFDPRSPKANDSLFTFLHIVYPKYWATSCGVNRQSLALLHQLAANANHVDLIKPPKKWPHKFSELFFSHLLWGGHFWASWMPSIKVLCGIGWCKG
jgi:hypothetical protein